MNKETEEHLTEMPEEPTGSPAGQKGDERVESSETTPETGETTEPAPDPLETQLLRLRADFDNYRKRITREKSIWTDQAISNLVEELLPAVDNFELGLDNAVQHNTQEGVLKGFQMVHEQLMATLTRFQVETIAAEDQEFNPEVHEAISYLPSEDCPADQVITQTRKGYRLKDKLLRPAQVVVSSGPAASTEESSDVDD